MDIFQNPFSNSLSLAARQTTGSAAQSKVALGTPSSSSVSSSRNIKDEYVSSVSFSSGTYKRSSISAVPSANEEIVPKGTVTDKMRQEMRLGDSCWTAMDLLPAAYPAFYEIIDQVFEEKGILEVESEKGSTFVWSLNPDGVFIFQPDLFNVEGVDQEFAEEICTALESALNSSPLNIKENPHFFTMHKLHLDYDPAEWGRTIDRDAWASSRDPDFGGFIEELRSDILKEFSNLNVVDFSLKIDDQGKLTIFDVKTEGNNPSDNAQATNRMNRGLTDEINKKAEYLGVLMLAAHAIDGEVLLENSILEFIDDGAKGEKEQFKHEVILTSGTNYKVVRAGGQSN